MSRKSTQLRIPFAEYPKQKTPKRTVGELVVNFLPDPAYIVSEVDLIYKSKAKVCDRPQIKCAKDAYNVFISTWDMNKIESVEHFKMLYLNKSNYVLGLFQMSTGGITGTVADPRIALVTGLKLNATSMIAAHNHPRVGLMQSRQDEDLSLKMKAAGNIVDLKLLDSMVITKNGFTSLAENGLL